MNDVLQRKKSSSITKKSISTRVSDPADKSRKPVEVISHNRRSTNSNDVIERVVAPSSLRWPRSNGFVDAKYAVPELNTALLLAKRLEDLKSGRSQKIQTFDQMTPRTKTIATEEVCHRKEPNSISGFMLICALPFRH